ncbi:hypothetical protein DTO212C5_238 [Paecilomyces variotii]|nr:hypothetical protein DTO169E5_5566 [Paecilomyces variotii]KAJ9273604.1 hypothetical protein DTO212C5_238 [Paecilomyces variotii]
MDHLILPSNPAGFRFEVPILSMTNYDGGDFLTYPNRQGWGPFTVAEWQAIFDDPPDDFLAFLQRWLYFGLIHVRLCPIDVKTVFLSHKRDQSGLPILTTQLLPAIALQAVERTSGNDDHGVFALRLCYNIHSNLQGEWGHRRNDPESLQSVESLYAFIMAEGPSDPRHPDHVLANMVLHDFGNITTHWSPSGPNEIMNQSLNFHPDTSRPYMWMALRQRGWCPSDIMPMTKLFTVSALIFIANLTPSPVGEEHRMINISNKEGYKPSSQRLCNELSCSPRQLSDDIYKTKHVDGCPGCDDIIADPTTSLNRGRIPLIVSIDPGDDSAYVEFVDAKSDMSYIAISHVWSDGLGNVERNALPRCQLLHLSSLIRNLPGKAADTVLFWLDTLCVPPDAADQKEAQDTALKMMRQVYENSTAVLVLDSWLMSTTCFQMSDTELLVRIFNAAWNRRLWTYQEGALAKAIFFLFRDDICDLDLTFRRCKASLDITTSTTIWPSLAAKYDSLRGFRMISSDREEALPAVMTAVAFRSTSQASDETLCLAALLNLDMEPILREKDVLSRMELFWAMMDSVPLNILCYMGDTIDKPGLRWAPRTLLLSASNIMQHTGEYFQLPGNYQHLPHGKPSSRGLRVQLRGRVFDVSDTTLTSYFYLIEEMGRCQRVVFHCKRKVWQYSEAVISDTGVGRREVRNSINPKQAFGATKVALLSFMGVESMMEDVGILVAIVEESEGIIYGRKLGSVVCRDESTRIGDFEGLGPGMTARVRNRGTDFLYGAYVEKKYDRQLWCIE